MQGEVSAEVKGSVEQVMLRLEELMRGLGAGVSSSIQWATRRFLEDEGAVGTPEEVLLACLLDVKRAQGVAGEGAAGVGAGVGGPKVRHDEKREAQGRDHSWLGRLWHCLPSDVQGRGGSGEGAAQCQGAAQGRAAAEGLLQGGGKPLQDPPPQRSGVCGCYPH
eukprot:404567-Hanusia_phi.AAC.2